MEIDESSTKKTKIQNYSPSFCYKYNKIWKYIHSKLNSAILESTFGWLTPDLIPQMELLSKDKIDWKKY